ncbi:MAG: hypothetical protein WAZ40_00515 [Minisyncoccia bacterium]
MTTANAVTDDSKMTNEQRGMLDRRIDEIKKRVNQNVIGYDWMMQQQQRIIEGLDVLLLTAISMILACTKSFNPAKFIGEGWSFWRGAKSGNGLDGEIEQDTRSASLSEFDSAKVSLVSMLRSGETSITGEENLARLKEAGHVRLGAKQFLVYWENQSTIPETWKDRVNGNIRYIYFDGDELRGSDGSRYVLSLCWDDGRWRWGVGWLGSGRGAHRLSAVLAS